MKAPLNQALMKIEEKRQHLLKVQSRKQSPKMKALLNQVQRRREQLKKQLQQK